jgi:methionyl-tRNA formyltransferase
MEKMRIVFMGTPDFAVTILKGILQSEHTVCGVITAPDKPAGRGRQLSESAVKKFAMENDLHILQPPNLKDETFQENLRALNADLFVVVAFRMLPESVWGIPSKGTINLHASLLPQYRGAAPINWAIINGETETGVSTFFIEKEIDTGKILMQKKLAITENMTAGDLHDALADLGKETVSQTLDLINTQSYTLIDQKDILPEDLKIAPKIHKEDTLVDFNQPVKKVVDFIRGMSPYPGAWCKLIKSDKILKTKIFEASASDKESQDKNSIIAVEDGFLFPCSDYFIKIKSIQIEGKRRLSHAEFVAGNDISEYKIVVE